MGVVFVDNGCSAVVGVIGVVVVFVAVVVRSFVIAEVAHSFVFVMGVIGGAVFVVAVVEVVRSFVFGVLMTPPF